MFNKLDHIAIVVKNTEEALSFYRDTLGLPVVLSEEMADSKVRLTHLDLGNVHLQLVEPLTPDHPLQQHLSEHGEGLHHLCMRVDNVPHALSSLQKKGLKPRNPNLHSAPREREAAFINPDNTRGILWELTGEKAV
jgi:methylmalonyl-CoA/ethylmalonyl-CoA epimerase